MSAAPSQAQPVNGSGDPGSTGTPPAAAAAAGATSASASTSNDDLLRSSSYDILDQSPSWKNAVSVFCGSSIGNNPSFKEAADQIGRALASQGIPLVYGGGTNGLMGAVAHATYEAGGRVLGIIPRALMSYERAPSEAGSDSIADAIQRPVRAHEAKESDRSIVIPVTTMHERKQEMAHYSDLGFIALPGGYGTFEEILEMVTWTQLRIHTKPVVLVNIDGFYSPLREFVRGAVKSGFIKKDNESFLVFVEPPDASDSAAAQWDWGKAAVEAVREWHRTEKGQAYQLKWESTRAR